MSKPLALLVEDRPEISTIWGKYLEPLDIDVVMASTLEEAFVVLKRIPPPDLVLLDLNLNHVETAEYTVRQIAKMKSYNPDMVVIVISGVITPELAQIAGAQGANAVHEKAEMQRQVDMWKAISASLTRAPHKTKRIFEHPLRLLEGLASRLQLL